MSFGDERDMRSIMKIFFNEGREMLAIMEECLLALEKDPANAESINSLFRSVHTIKGSSGMFDLEAVMSFTHAVENVLDDLRNGSLAADESLVCVLLDCHDHIGRLIDMYEKDPAAVLDEDLARAGRELLVLLGSRGSAPAASGAQQAVDEVPREWGVFEGAGDAVESGYWHISLRYGADVFRNGLDPKSFIAYLAEKGKIVNIAVIDDALPDLGEMDPESCYLGFEIAFEGECGKKEIMDVFEFASDDCDVRILPPRSGIGDYVQLINDLGETPMRLGEILTRIGSLTERELETALAQQKERAGDGADIDGQALLGSIMVDGKMVHKPVLDAALARQKDMIRAEERKNKSLRIDSEKLDDLINNIGELVITGSNVRQLADRHGDAPLNQSITALSRLIESVRDRIMNICMVQIGDTFRRFERMVRDLGLETGKEVDLVITGGDTELDKTIIERITDPLMHLVRNSIDHGIDVPEERARRGKPRRGTIAIHAYHETGNIVIEIRDDGNGLDCGRIRARAIEKGMISPSQEVADRDLFQMIFEPGFSTAEKVTSISGRGVGMDVVKKNVEALRGTIILESEEGSGMMVRIHLPLTLAIIDGFMVMVNGSCYIVPLDHVCEVFETDRGQIGAMDGANIINLRGEALPFMRLREFFGQDGDPPGTECVLVVEYMRRKAGIVVDRPVGEFQTVIKPLGALFRDLSWVSGATILGTGEVALILDVPRLIQGAHFAGAKAC